jgi:predicted nucleic acid-binding protein
VNAVFLDTVGMIALWHEADQWHDAAQQAYDDLRHARREVITTTYVLLECGNTAARRPFRSAVSQWRDTLAANNGLIDPTPDDRREAWEAYDRGEFGNAGIIDQVSFVVMRRLGVSQAFTNDSHFTAAGFATLF